MKTLVVLAIVIVSCISCVTKSKYEDLLHEIAKKEKQQQKLHTQVLEHQNRIIVLRDSAQRLGGAL